MGKTGSSSGGQGNAQKIFNPIFIYMYRDLCSYAYIHICIFIYANYILCRLKHHKFITFKVLVISN